MATRKDYETIAAVISKVGQELADADVKDLSLKGQVFTARCHARGTTMLAIEQGLAEAFKAENPNFDRADFMAACNKYQKRI